MALLVVLAFAGAFGDGPLSHVSITAADGSTVALNLVMRAENPEQVLLTRRASANPVTLAIDSATMGWLTLESTVPRASAERRGAGQFELDVVPIAGETMAVELLLTPHVPGRHLFRARVGDGSWINVRILVLP